ncbi:LacI family DNA-binding transcriptional regulator [Sphingomonas nostoxanthinifaciens]|uniref:LacI family DNA-binding transcriptional regulator n=1 Tax=Sphingomonas nostoxanthinifaciens TaxID=2872652 RepID=UPI001CC1FC37|nr:LacI family DNA-binding transcriptional regulator [Sphingomonas nostoxanthinifaciens]UAK23717.1 LacI family transcriptional regulator [Sphingomonas nostoxanthinifaciens]
MPTIIDVANAAGVSTATVSRVLSGSGRVVAETRARVLAAVERLGYAPNVAARSLRTTRAGKLLVTVPDISNPFFSNVIRGAEAAARGIGYSVVLGDTRHDAAIENQYAEMLAKREVDGLIFLGHRLPDSLATLVRASAGGAPVVNGCEYSPGLDVPSVHIDNAGASEEAVAHLIGLGHRDIGIVTGPMASPLGRDRVAGARKAMAMHGLADRLQIDHGDYSVEAGAAAAHRLLAGGVTALFCCSDEMAMGALSAIRATGRICPTDISLVGFDDIRFARFLEPALTTIAQPQQEIGRETVRLLHLLITGQHAAATSVTLPYRLVVRDSTAPFQPR